MSAKKNRQQKSVAARAKRRDAARAGRPDTPASLPPMDPPFGYRAGDDGELQTDADETAVIERMRELADQRLGVQAIADQLNAAGDDARGNPWDARTVSRLLRRKVEKRFVVKEENETRRAARAAREATDEPTDEATDAE